MKLNKILSIGAIFALALGLASCDKDKNEPENVNGGTGEKGWTSFTIALPTASGLRAEATDVEKANRGDTYGGTAGEQKVELVRIVLYKDDVVKYALTPDIKADGTTPFTGDDVSTEVNATKSRFTTKAFEIEKAEYEVFVFLNPTEFVNNNTKIGMHKNELMNKSADYDEATLTSDKGFFMSNAKEGVKTTGANFQPTAEAAEAASASVKVPVERAVAKVFVNKEVPEKGVANGAKAEVKRFALDVINKKYFAVRHMGLTTDGKKEEPKGTTATDRMASYAVDPNMAGSPVLFAKAKPAQLTAEFYYIGAGKTFADKTFTDPDTRHTVKEPGFSDANGIYVAENTMDAAEQYEVATTRVVFEVVYAPAGIDPGNSFVEYKGMTFKPEAFQAKIDEYVQDNEKTDADLGMPAGFTAAVKALGTGTKLDFTTESFVKGDIKFYYKGINYYKTTIRHFHDDLHEGYTDVDMHYGRYGVVRNNIYKLSITKISGPGEPLIPEPEPEIPDDPKKNYLAVDVTVLPWLVRTQDVEL